MLYALDMSVHRTHIVYGVECPCRGLHTFFFCMMYEDLYMDILHHTLVMGLSAVTQIALHWCVVTPHYMRVRTWY